MTTDTAVGYVRLSQQSDRSITPQYEDIPDYCDQAGISLVEIYNEGKGESGYDNELAHVLNRDVTVMTMAVAPFRLARSLLLLLD